MKRLLRNVLAFVATLAMGFVLNAATPPSSGQTYYGLFVGVNYYSNGVKPLSGCDRDAVNMLDAYTASGFCVAANATAFIDYAATKAAVRAKFAELAGKAKAGDTVLYYQSSHGGDYSDDKGSYLCMTDGDWLDTEFAEDLEKFVSGVRVVVIIDACYSGGMFKAAGASSRAVSRKRGFGFAARVQRHLKSRLESRKGTAAKGGASVGWITACDWNERSTAGDFGSIFTNAIIDGWRDGSADVDYDDYVSFSELAEYAMDNVDYDEYGQSTQVDNESLLSSVLAGSVYDMSEFRPLVLDGTFYGFVGPCPASVTIPAGVERIAESAFDTDFNDAWALESVTIPSSVTEIGIYAFYECGNLTTVTFEGDISDIRFEGGRSSVFLNTPWLDSKDIPQNDDFADAISLPAVMEGGAIGTSLYASVEEDEPLYVDQYAASTVWWTWTAPATGPMQFNTFGSDFDTIMGVYTGDFLDGLTLVADNDDAKDSGGEQSQVAFNAVAGTTYYIAVGGYDDEGAISLNWGPYEGEILPPAELEWCLYRGDAIAAALSEGKRILLVSGRDTCLNTTYFRETACYDPDVMEILQEDFILWYNDHDNLGEEVWGYTDELAGYVFPLVCVLDPYDMDTYIDRSTGFMNEDDLYDFLTNLPDWTSGVCLEMEDGWVTGYFGEMPDGEFLDLEIPDGVVGIEDDAFAGLAELRTLYIPASVTYIGESAFSGCSSLEAVYFLADDSATESSLEIGGYAFEGCESLETVSFEDRPYDPANEVWNEIVIGEGAFDGCGLLSDLYLGDGVVEIGDSAFAGCGIESLDIPASVTYVGGSAFFGCSSLKSVYFLADDSATESSLEIGEYAFEECESLETVSFEDRPYDPANEVWNEIAIGESAFDGCELLSDLYLGEGVAEIGDYAFYAIGIDTLEVPASCYFIGDYAFAYSENLMDVSFAGYEVYGDDYEIEVDIDCAFEGTPWLECPEVWQYTVTFDAAGGSVDPSSVTCNYGEAVGSLPTPSRTGYTFLGWYSSAAGGTQIASSTTVTADATYYAQWRINTYTVTFDAAGGSVDPSSITCNYGEAIGSLPTPFLEGYTFLGWYSSAAGGTQIASSTTVTADATYYAQWQISTSGVCLEVEDGWVTGYFGEMPDGEFLDLEIPDGVVGIEDGALAGLAGLRTLYIPASVTYIGEYAFEGCSDLEEIYFEEKEPELVERTWTDDNDVTHSESGFGFEEMLDIGMSAFAGCESLAWLDIPTHAGYIGESAFSGCSSLESVCFLADDSATESSLEIGGYAFEGCESLETVSFEDRPYDPANEVWNEIAIGESAFDGCELLSDLYLGEGVAEIGDYAFYAIGIDTLEVPASCNFIGDYAFAYSENLTDVRFAGYEVYGDDYEIEVDIDCAFEGTPWLECQDELGWQYTVTFDAAGGSVDPSSVTRNYGEAIGSLPTPSRTGYTFLGWYSSAAGGTLIASSTTVTADATYYAQWRINTYTVTFDAAGGSVDPSSVTRNYGEAVGALPIPSRTGYTFLGWYSSAAGGTLVTGDRKETANVTYYAYWQVENTLWNGDEAFGAEAAAVFDGFLTRDGEVRGSIQVKIGKANARTGVAKASASVTLLGQSKKLSYKGVFGKPGAADGFAPASASLTCDGQPSLELRIGSNALWGELGSYGVEGSRNVFAKAGDAMGAAALTAWQGSYTLVLETVDADGSGSAFAWGYSGLTLTVGARGKVKVSGTMVDGAKVNVSSQLLVGERRCCIPVVVPLYSKNGGFGFNLWLQDDGTLEVGELSAWDAAASKTPFRAWFGESVPVARVGGALPSSLSFLFMGEPDVDGVEVLYEFVPWEVEIATGSRWTLPAAGNVKYDRAAGTFVDAKDTQNASGLKLTYVAKTGAFKGTFKLYAADASGRLKKYTANVSGVMVGRQGYGTATVKNVGSWPVSIQ